MFLQSQGFDVWMAIENGYIIPDTIVVVGTTERRLFENIKALYAIHGGLMGSKFLKEMHCTSAKETWDKLKSVYQGDGKVKGDKLQTYRMQFEHLMMMEEEDIAYYFLWVDEIVNTMRGLGE